MGPDSGAAGALLRRPGRVWILAYLIAWIVMPNEPHAYVVQAGTQAAA
ncbi:hypothetical protein [Granulicella sp. S156]|nr:hypothetical protein [Granulicella sp. S156]